MHDNTSKQIDQLECRLAELAFEFRKAEAGGSEAKALAFDYGQTYEQLVNLAQDHVEPDFDSLLPEEWMPALYRLRMGSSTQAGTTQSG